MVERWTKRWIGIVGVTNILGGGRSTLLEKTLDEFVKQGTIDAWRFADVGPCLYDVLTNKDVGEIERNILDDIKKKLAEGRIRRWHA
ncbi:MAG: hypothetical protein ACE5Z5_06945 [Candidatus Bathyarchaeia archaeon]